MYLIKTGKYAGMIGKSNNRSGAGGVTLAPGVVTTLGAAFTDIIHAIPLNRSFYVRNLSWYNNTGANVTLVFGTITNAAPGVMVPVFPTQLAINTIPGGLNEEDLTSYEFLLNSAALAAGWTGSLYVTASAAGVEISAEIAEKA